LNQRLPDVPEQITNVILNWPSTLATFDRAMKEHQARGERLQAANKLREAYMEFAINSVLKGPEAEKAKQAQTAIKETWMKMVSAAQQFAEGTPGREAIVTDLRAQVAKLDV